MDTIRKRIPNKRFTGFEGEWVEQKLGEVLQLKARPIKMGNEEEYSLVTVKRQYGGIVFRGTYRGKEIKVKSQFILKENDFLISKRQICHNACAIVPKDYENSIVSNEYSVFVPRANLNITYFNYFCHHPRVSHSFYLSSIGVHIEKMLFKVSDWLKWKFSFPTLPEQQKIAGFLTAVDEKINRLTRKKTLLEQYKKGVMQQIFAQEIRFKDDEGKAFPGWEEEQLNNIVDKSHTKYNPLNESTVYPCIELESLSQGTGILLHTFNSKDMKSIKNKFHKGEVLFGKLRPYLKKVLKAPFDGVCSSEIWVLQGKKIYNEFLYYLIQTERFMNIANAASGSKMPRADWAYMSNFSFTYPSLPEQQKIADFLTGIDKKIEQVDSQLETTKQWKRGLLQQLFV